MMFKRQIAMTMTLAMAMGTLLTCPIYADTQSATTDAVKLSMSQTQTQSQAQANQAMYQGIITSITNKQITVKSNLTSQGFETIVFNLSKDTKFENCHLTELSEGDTIRVNHSLAMTRSLPPQAAAFSVQKYDVATDIQQQTFDYSGVIKDVHTDRDNVLILVQSTNGKEANKEIRFVVSKDTKVVGGKVSDLKNGTKVKLTYGMVMTMSLPPQTSALTLEIEKKVQKTYELEGKITKVEKNGTDLLVTVVTGGSKNTRKTMVFVVSSNTKILDGKLSDIKVGEEVEVKYGESMTKSNPPQAAAFSIELD